MNSTTVTQLPRPVGGFLHGRFPSGFVKKFVFGAGAAGCSGYLCSIALSRVNTRRLEERVEEMTIEIKQLKLEQQYLQYSIQEMNNSQYKTLSMMKKKLKVQNDTISQLMETDVNKYRNISTAMTSMSEQIDYINDFKLVKLQNIFQKDIEQVCESLQLLEKDLPACLNKSEAKLLNHIDKQSKAMHRLLVKSNSQSQ